MAIFGEQAVKSALKNGNKNIYILFGDDGYLKKLYRDKIIKNTCDADDVFNFQAFTSDCELQDVYDAVLQFPMMSDKKCVVLDDYDFEHCKAEDFEKLCGIIGENPETCVLILSFDSVEFDVKKSNKFKKIVELAEKNSGFAADLSHRGIPELAKMLTDGAKKRGYSFDGSAARYLVETAGQDINILVNELEKLCAYSKGGTITKQTVDKVATKTVEAKIYDLSLQIVNCNIEAALKNIDELYFMRVEPIVILSTVSGFYVDLYRVFTGKKKGIALNEISEKFGYGKRAFVLERAAGHLKKFDSNKFYLSLEALCEADKSLKSFSGNDRTVLERLIVKLCYIITKGEGID